MTAQLLAAVLALVVLTILPGQDVALVTRAAIGSGRAATARVATGITLGLVVWGTLTVAGLAALLAASATAYSVVKFAGAIYLLFLGLQTLIRSRGKYVDGKPATEAPMRRPLRAGLMNNLLNPKIAVFYTSLLPALVPTGMGHTLGLTLLVVIHVAITIVWLLIYGEIVRRATNAFQRPAVRRTLDRITGCVLVGFGLRVALEPRH